MPEEKSTDLEKHRSGSLQEQGQDLDKRRTKMLARLATSPSSRAAQTIAEFAQGLGDLSLVDLVAELVEQTTMARNSHSEMAETMLVAQAQTLDAIFNRLARTALRSKYLDQLEVYLKLSLRAQAQSRATWEAVSSIKNPRMASYVKQANISQGHQQVNNCPQGVAQPKSAKQTNGGG